MDVNKYTYLVSWSVDNSECVATVPEFPSLSRLAADRREAENGLVDLVVEVIEDMEQPGETIPTPRGERSYSGKFNVHTSRPLHRRLVILAETAGVSLNALINQKLASA